MTRRAARLVDNARRSIRLAAFVCLVASLALSVGWLIRPSMRWWEPAGNLMLLLSAVLAIPGDRWAGEAERRREVIRALRAEAADNERVLGGRAFRPAAGDLPSVFPRLRTVAAEAALNSGSLDRVQDQEVRDALLAWRNLSDDLNHRLGLTEVRLCLGTPLAREEELLLRTITDTGGPIDTARQELAHLARLADQVRIWA